MKSLIRILKDSAPAKPLRQALHRRRDLELHRKIMSGCDLPLPAGLVFEPTQRCNLSCIMCCHRQHHTEQSCTEMDTAQTCRFIRSLKDQHNFKTIGFIGSEPFLRGDLEELLQTAAEGGTGISVQTNSTLLSDERLTIWEGYKDQIRNFGASLEGVEGIDDSIRLGRDVFQKARQGIELAVKHRLPVTVSILILDSNRERLPELVRLLDDLNVRAIDISLIVNHRPSNIERTAELAGLYVNDICITSLPELDYKTETEMLLNDMRSVIKLGKELGMSVSTSPDCFLEYYSEIRSGEIRAKRRLSCGALNAARVDPSGNLIHCQHIRHNFGNLNEMGFQEAWNSPEYKAFRKRLVAENLFPICVDCYRMRVMQS
jgi:radical SAM protein with 4Fe4S-binding SPASM domain